MEHTSDPVLEGKIIHESTYSKRAGKYEEIELGGIKIDFYNTKEKVIHEIKKSSKMHEAHIWQLKYYIYVFEKAGIKGVSGILEYPKERKTEEVYLSSVDIEQIKEIETEIEKITSSEQAPKIKKMARCKSCSYYDFCFISESNNY